MNVIGHLREDPKDIKRAKLRAMAGYLLNAAEPDSTWVDEQTLAELQRAAYEWADAEWRNYL